MSNAIAFWTPLEAAIRPAATTPAAGPERRINAGCAAASSIDATPPDERITSGAGSPASAADVPSAVRYRLVSGPRYASTAAGDARP